MDPVQPNCEFSGSEESLANMRVGDELPANPTGYDGIMPSPLAGLHSDKSHDNAPDLSRNGPLEKILFSIQLILKKLDGLEDMADFLKASLKNLEFKLSNESNRVKHIDVSGSTINRQIKGSTPVKVDMNDNKDEAQHGTGKMKMKVATSVEEDTNIIMDVSDTEGDQDVMEVDRDTMKSTGTMLSSRPTSTLMKNRVPSLGYSPDKGKTKGTPVLLHGSQSSGGGTKSFRNPCDAPRPTQMQRRDMLGQVPCLAKDIHQQPLQPPKIQYSLAKSSSSNTSRLARMNNISLRKEIRTRFSPTPDMNLSMPDTELAGYVFSTDLDLNEVLIKIGAIVATRQELQCMCPGFVIEDKIIKLMAMKCTWNQQHNTSTMTTWSLPPSFAEDVFVGLSIEDLMLRYANEYMQPTPNLQYVYVPIKDNGCHWFLMVLCMNQKITYHLDSFLPVDQVEHRRDMIKTVGEVIAQMICTDYYHNNSETIPDFNGWEIMEARGIPNCDHSDNSAVWVMDWMDMENAFQPNLVGVLNENVVRMKATLAFIRGDSNERKKIVEARTETF